MSHHPIDGIMKDLSELAQDRETVELGALVGTLEARGFGPLLMVLAALMLLPVGMLPGFPAVIGLLFILCGAQMVRGAKGLWLPERLKRIEAPADTLRKSLDKAWPAVRRLRKLIGGRMHWAVSGGAARVIAGLLIVIGAAMAGLGFLPGLPFLLALPVLLFGLGLTAGDGLVVILGVLLLVPAIWTGTAAL
ncbi:exopolysaccharide biosynthesis protein [Poseidonocella sp. HB161398]|uniref:exopolysaccharide biosynthesis protein n=1 Tax=Poseidonocella sp. HB161398 TaxID=2320855 RepID=UPI0011087067|nr:exopolysaccharide biosynthesis protein [Poseidonocella sp. HB161398]